MYIYLSLCTYTPSERWSFSVPSYLYARLLRDCWRHPLFDIWFLPAPSGSVCPSASCLWLLFCVPRRRFRLLPGTFAHLLFGYDCCFLTTLLPNVSVLYLSDYLVTESWNIKDNIFCIIPGLHLVPYPSVTLWSYLYTTFFFFFTFHTHTTNNMSHVLTEWHNSLQGKKSMIMSNQETQFICNKDFFFLSR